VENFVAAAGTPMHGCADLPSVPQRRVRAGSSCRRQVQSRTRLLHVDVFLFHRVWSSREVAQQNQALTLGLDPA
jgi:hypothetical protein